MANIVLKDVSGNNIYPEIDASTLSGTITENATGFVIGGDVYSALSGKADKSDIKPQAQSNWNVTDSESPSFIVGKPTLYSCNNYNDEDYRGLNPPYNWNIHTITEDDLTAKQFKLKLPFPAGKASEASNVRLFGDVYGIRGLNSSGGGINGTTFLNGYIDSIVLTLGDSDGNLITNEPTIRKIDSTEFTKSDRNDGENLNQCRFHFSHFGSASSNLQKITTVASYLLIIVNLPSSTQKFKAGEQFQILVNWVHF